MAKKIYARARLVKGEGRGKKWKIDYSVFDPKTGEETRHRKDFDLNEIPDLTVREAVALRIVQNIEVFAGSDQGKRDCLTLKRAVEMAAQVKQALPRANSRRKYITVSKKFLAWARRSGVDQLPVDEFSTRKALEFWDGFNALKLRGRTKNNYLATLRALWSVLIDREHTDKNPWERVKPSRKQEKLRRPFTDDERRTVAEYAEKNDYWLFRGILLQFYCYIRPTEMVNLKFKDFNLAKGLVTVQEGSSKTWRKVVKTIPKSVLPYFVDGRFDKEPANYFVFGRVGDARRGHMEPSPVQIHHNRPYLRHAKLLKKLKAAGALADIEGLTWYSWKDTGISLHARSTTPLATRDQAGHTDFSMTLVYYQQEDINQEYRNLPHDLV